MRSLILLYISYVIVLIYHEILEKVYILVRMNLEVDKFHSLYVRIFHVWFF